MDYLAAIFELTGLWLIGNKRRIGFVLNICGGITWIYVAITRGVYGLLAIGAVAIGVNIWNYWKWRK